MKRPALKILGIALLISFLGVLSIYSNTYRREGEFWQEIYQRQVFWIILGLLFFRLAYNFNYHRFWDGTYFLYALAIFLLCLVAILGRVSFGAQRWLSIARFNFQPAELVKLIMLIVFARYFSAKSPDALELKVAKSGIFRAVVVPFLFAGLPMALIMEQPDLGSSLLIFFIFIAMLYLGRVRLRYICIFLLALVLVLPLFWHLLRDYQKDRLLVFLNPGIDPLGAGYTVIQSKIAVGSASLFGKGWLGGTQSQLRFLPESHTDFIFATFVEERGLLGGLILLLLYYFLIREGLYIGETTQNNYGKLLAFGIASLLCAQVFINIAMNLGLAPVVGLPLPLMSYGGSSVVITFVSLGILANIYKTRAVF